MGKSVDKTKAKFVVYASSSLAAANRMARELRTFDRDLAPAFRFSAPPQVQPSSKFEFTVTVFYGTDLVGQNFAKALEMLELRMKHLVTKRSDLATAVLPIRKGKRPNLFLVAA